MQAIVTKSYHAVGLKEILDEAGVPKGSFYHYFRSKEEFAVSIIEYSTEVSLKGMREVLLDRSRSPLGRIRCYFESCLDHHRECGVRRECLMAKLGLETSLLSETMRAAVKCGFDQVNALLAQVIREAQAAGEVAASEDPERLAGFLSGAWEGAMIRMQVDRDVRPVNDFLEIVFTRLLRK